jgi:hypothetical protein
MFQASVAALLLATSALARMSGASQDEIDRTGDAIMEERRTALHEGDGDDGTFFRIADANLLDAQVDMVGKGGLAFAGFFVSPTEKDGAHVADPLFDKYKAMATDQSWLADHGYGDKRWSFMYR